MRRASGKHAIPSINCDDIKQQVVSVLSETQWQTIGLVAAQVVFAPELVARREIVSGYACNGLCARNNLVAKILQRLVTRGLARRKKNKNGRWVYTAKHAK